MLLHLFVAIMAVADCSTMGWNEVGVSSVGYSNIPR